MGSLIYVLLPEKCMNFINAAMLSGLEEVTVLMCCSNFMVEKSLAKDYDCAATISGRHNMNIECCYVHSFTN
jgi:hypothetical protein